MYDNTCLIQPESIRKPFNIVVRRMCTGDVFARDSYNRGLLWHGCGAFMLACVSYGVLEVGLHI